MVHFLDVAVAVHYKTVAAKMVLHIEMHDYAATFIHTCVAAVEEDGGKPVVVVDEIWTVMVVCICSKVYLYTMFLSFSTWRIL